MRNILIVVPGKKEKLPLSVTHPELAKEANSWDPETLLAGSHKKVSWKCPLGHIWDAVIKDRTTRGDGCSVCAGKTVLPGFNDLATFYPELINEVNGWDPTKYTQTSGAKLSWKCKLGHTWEVRIADRTYYKSGCPTCSGRIVLFGFNDLQTLNPRIAAEANGWDPKTVHFHSSKKYSWKCIYGHEWDAVVENRVIQDSNCLVCGNRKLLKGFNDLKTRFPSIAEQAHGWDPTEIMAGSNRHQWWKCSEGHKWKARVADRTGQSTGCPTCSKTGFSPDEDGYLYLLVHQTWDMFQVGITNNPETRLGNHRNLGWDLIEIRGPMVGHLTQQWETAILRMLKANGADLSNEKVAGKFDGYSEAWSKSTFDVKSIKELMRLTEDFEESKHGD